MDLSISELHLTKPPWTLRNKLIAEQLDKGKSILDIGGGAGDLKKYYTPSRYLNVDGMPMDQVDLKLDLNEEYQLQIEPGWDYAVNSGILEWVSHVDKFLYKQRSLASEYIFTWHIEPMWGRMSFDSIESIIKDNYTIIDTIPWGSQNIYKCRAL